MKEITNEQYNTALSKAPENIRSLMGSTQIYDCTEKILRAAGSATNADDLLLPIGYYLLGINGIEETVADIESLGVKNSLRFLVDVKECIESNSKNQVKEIAPANTPSQPPTQVPPPSPVASGLTAEIQAAEKELEEVQSIRTMASDMKEAQHSPTYSSSQDDLIRPTPTAPPPAPPTGPRWETDSHS